MLRVIENDAEREDENGRSVLDELSIEVTRRARAEAAVIAVVEAAGFTAGCPGLPEEPRRALGAGLRGGSEAWLRDRAGHAEGLLARGQTPGSGPLGAGKRAPQRPTARDGGATGARRTDVELEALHAGAGACQPPDQVLGTHLTANLARASSLKSLQQMGLA